MPPEVFEQFSTCHLLLQSMRFDTEFLGGPPWSIFWFRTHRYDDRRLNFDFRDSLFGLTMALRLGDVGVIASLEDHNILEEVIGSDFEQFHHHPLHPIQFVELPARIVYLRSLLNRTPKFLTQLPAHGQMQVVCVPLGGFSTKPIFDEWDHKAYAKVLSQHTRVDLNLIFREPDNVWTWLLKEDGSPRLLGADDLPPL